MSKYAILSDIHSNLEALQVVLAKCRELGITDYLCLGDVVGYNANPNECLKIIRELNVAAIVRGNHDDLASSGDAALAGFNPSAQAAIRWTREQLSKEEREWLGNLAMRTTVKEAGVTIVHATLDSPQNWGYVFDPHHAEDNFHYQFTPICFCGHSHVPVAFARKPLTVPGERSIDVLTEWTSNLLNPAADDDFSIADSLTVECKKGAKYLFNIGSIGQPRNHDPRASFAVFDPDAYTVTRYRIPYDFSVTQKKVLDAGLPQRLANRLALGN